MSDKEWDQITEVHLKGAFSCTKAAWPLFRKQKFGRVINTSSAAGLYGTLQILSLSFLSHRISGNFGQANYSAAKMGLVAFTKTLAREGAKYNIKSTAIAPVSLFLYFPQRLGLTTNQMAASAMTETVMPPEMLANMSACIFSYDQSSL